MTWGVLKMGSWRAVAVPWGAMEGLELTGVVIEMIGSGGIRDILLMVELLVWPYECGM